MKRITANWSAIRGKLRITLAKELESSLAVLEAKEDKTEPTSAENFSEANKSGKIPFRGLIKSICCTP